LVSASAAASLAFSIAVTLFAPGCGGDRSAATVAGPMTPPPPATRCGPPEAEAKAVWISAGDGTRLDAALVGDGKTGVVFVHEHPGPPEGAFCGWWPFAAWLAEHDVRSLLLNLRCFGASGCPAGHTAETTADVRGAITALRRLGSERIVLVGASLGGVVVIKAAAEIRPPVDGVVDLSGELDLGNLLGGGVDLDAGAAARRVVSPALIAVARDDPHASVEDTKIVSVVSADREHASGEMLSPFELGHLNYSPSRDTQNDRTPEGQ
jgi:pimeloyl-ACP methyl ester carboxylesterase